MYIVKIGNRYYIVFSFHGQAAFPDAKPYQNSGWDLAPWSKSGIQSICPSYSTKAGAKRVVKQMLDNNYKGLNFWYYTRGFEIEDVEYIEMA